MATNNAINLSAAGIVGYDGAGTFNGNAVTQHSILIGGANSHTINNLGVATNGQIPIGSTGADPVLATLTAGTGVTITNAAGGITINSSGGGLTWVDVTGTSASGAINTGYIADNAGLVTLTLPATAAQGTLIAIVGGNSGAGGWKIAQNSGQQINFGKSVTTSGTGGSLASTFQYDCAFLLCTTANTNWVVFDAVGNLTVT
jgi:hypothetical protein